MSPDCHSSALTAPPAVRPSCSAGAVKPVTCGRLRIPLILWSRVLKSSAVECRVLWNQSPRNSQKTIQGHGHEIRVSRAGPSAAPYKLRAWYRDDALGPATVHRARGSHAMHDTPSNVESAPQCVPLASAPQVCCGTIRIRERARSLRGSCGWPSRDSARLCFGWRGRLRLESARRVLSAPHTESSENKTPASCSLELGLSPPSPWHRWTCQRPWQTQHCCQ